MKAFVITIMDNELSLESAKRCVASGAQNGTHIELFPAITPGVKLDNLLTAETIPRKLFSDQWCRTENALAAFMSHHSLWKRSVEENEDILILEHDAIFVGIMPDPVMLGLVTSLAVPSYGNFKTPTTIGLNLLTSKPYFPGAHAYVVKPKGAKQLLAMAKECAQPTDIFLNSTNFPWLNEWYPWIVEARDTFTTIQKEQGCFAKHTYKKNPDAYKIIKA